MFGLGVAGLVERGEEGEFGLRGGRGKGWVVGYLVGHFGCLPAFFFLGWWWWDGME